MTATLKQRIANGDTLLGTWVKTPSPMVCEVLADTELDLLCLDAEHSPFDRTTLDLCLGILDAKSIPTLVRVPSSAPEHTLNALDCAATGVVVPHVSDADTAAKVVKQTHYGPGGRGFAGSTRAARYTGRKMADHLASSAESTVVFAQIENVEAVDNIEAIAAVEGVDCLLVGRMDLTVAMGAAAPNDPKVFEAVERICKAGVVAGRPVGMFLSDLAELPHWRDLGATVFLMSSDHSCMLAGVRQLVADFRHQIS